MKEKIRTIDLKQYVKYCLEKLYIVIPVTLICMALLVAINYKEQDNVINNEKKEALDKVMTQNHNAFYFKDDKYSDAEPPKGIYNSIAAIYIDSSYDELGSIEGYDLSSYVSRLGNDYISILVNINTLSEIIDELNLTQYPEFKNLTAEKFRWLINKNFQGAHVINLIVSDVDPERAKLIADKLIEKFVKNVKEYSYVKDVRILSAPNVPEDGGLFSVSGGEIKTGISKGQIIKYAVVGMIIGICLMAAVLFVVFVVCDTVRTGNDLVFAEVEQLVNINRKKVDYKRIAYSINNESKDLKKILIVSVDNKISAEETADKVKEELKKINKEITIDYADDFIHEPDALAKAGDNDALVYLVKYGKTRMRDMIDARNSLDRSDAVCLGGVIL